MLESLVYFYVVIELLLIEVVTDLNNLDCCSRSF
jgi:hypothetical protein